MQAAVVIGVDKVGGGLPALTAAASGANEVADWLKSNGYQVDILTDKAKPVERRAVFQAVEALVNANNVERLVIYFAGHGFLNGPVDEYWLLSGAPSDASEAVNVTASSKMALYKGIPQVIFISDACRVVPKTGVHSGINGASIFPNTKPSHDSAEIDFYYGTHPGDPAYERGSSEAHQAHGLFTQALLDAHKGAPPEALLQINHRDYVRNDWLKGVLRNRVDLHAQTISLALTQRPDVQIQIKNGYIAENQAAVTKSMAQPGGAYSEFALVTELGGSPVAKRVLDTADEKIDTTIVSNEAKAEPAYQARLESIKQPESAIVEAESIADYHPNSVTCRGDTIIDLSTPFDVKVDAMQSTFGFHFQDRQSTQAAVQFEDGTGMLLPILREYSCEIVRNGGRTISLTYSWIRYRDSDLAALRAEVIGAASLGLLNRSREAARSFASRIRQSKRYDPILGVVAALAYATAGDFEGASSVRDYMRGDLQIDLFDTWLLGGAEGELPICPPVPLLSQTWSFIEAFSTSMPEELKRLPRVPGFWTVFEAEAMETVMRVAKYGHQEAL